jgi:hypothetical protein
MKTGALQKSLGPFLIILGAGAFGWLLYFGGAWLVHHDRVYYRISDAGFRPVTNLAEELFFVGPIFSVLVGLALGASLVLTLRWHRAGHPG